MTTPTEGTMTSAEFSAGSTTIPMPKGYAQPRHVAPAAGNAATPAKFAKAIGAALLAGLGVLYIALNDNQVTAQEWVGIAQAAAAAGAVVYGVPNKGAGA